MIKSIREKEIDLAVVQKMNAEASDWTATCPICKVTLTGTPAKLAEHKHDVK